jgi:hypothetical protein
MMFSLLLMVSFPLIAAESPQKVPMSDDVVCRLNEIEIIYKGYLTSGMTATEAARETLKWQEIRYPTIMYPLPEEDYKDETDHKPKPKIKKGYRLKRRHKKKVLDK